MSEKVEWKEKKVSLGGAIIVGAIFALIGVVVGVNWNSWFGGYGIYSGIGSTDSGINWSALDEVYGKLAATYNGEISKEDVLEGAKKGLTDALGDKYTVYMGADEASDFYDDFRLYDA